MGRTAYVEDDERVARWDRITAIVGLIFLVLIVARFFTPSTPASGSSVERIARALTDDRAGHQMALLLGFLTAIAFLVFLAGLGWFGGFLLFLVWVLAASVLLLRLAYRTHAAA